MNTTEDIRRDAGECERIASEAWGEHGRLLGSLDRCRSTAERAERMSLALSRHATFLDSAEVVAEVGSPEFDQFFETPGIDL